MSQLGSSSTICLEYDKMHLIVRLQFGGCGVPFIILTLRSTLTRLGFNGISTIVGYLMPKPLSTYILHIYYLVWLGFLAYQPLYVISPGPMSNRLHRYILNIYDLVWLGFNGISTIVGYLMPKPLSTYILHIYYLVWLGFLAYQPLYVI